MKISLRKYYIFIESDTLVSILGTFSGLGNDAQGIGFFPFLIIRQNLKLPHKRQELINHEKIHLVQQIELLIVGAFLLHLLEYLYARFIKKLSKRDSYYFPATEQEAHRNAMNQHYLTQRKIYAVLHYIGNKKKLSRDMDDNLIVEDYDK